MKKFLISIALCIAPLFAMAATNVGLYINLGQPNYYGPIQIGNVRPPVIFANPIIIQPVPGVAYSPLYLRVPPGHYKNWRHYCGNWGACNRPVYFVNDSWYRNTYVPQYRHQPYPRHEFGRGPHRHYDNGHHYGHRKYDRHHRSHDKRH